MKDRGVALLLLLISGVLSQYPTIKIVSPLQGQRIAPGQAELEWTMKHFRIPSDGSLIIKLDDNVVGELNGPMPDGKEDFNVQVGPFHEGAHHLDLLLVDLNKEVVTSDSSSFLVYPLHIPALENNWAGLVDWTKLQAPKFLVFKIEALGYGGGYGDRMIGLTHTALLASMSGRGFLIDWQFPVDITQHFEPVGVEWRFDRVMAQYPALKQRFDAGDVEDIDWVMVMNTDIERMPVMNFHEEHPATFVVIRANFCFCMHAAQNPLYLPTLSNMTRILGPVYRQIFKPLPHFQQKIDAWDEYFDSAFVIGIHARTRQYECGRGGGFGDYVPTCVQWDGLGRQKFFENYFWCAQNVIKTLRLDPTKVKYFVASDSQYFVEIFKHYMGPNVTGSVPGLPFHIDYAVEDQSQTFGHSAEEMLDKLLLETYLLGRSDEVIGTLTSNFGRIAAMLFDKLPLVCHAGGDCVRLGPHVTECKHDQRAWMPDLHMHAEIAAWEKALPRFGLHRDRNRHP